MVRFTAQIYVGGELHRVRPTRTPSITERGKKKKGGVEGQKVFGQRNRVAFYIKKKTTVANEQH